MEYKLDFQRWKQDHLKYLSKLANKNISVLFTGGKDSSLILDFMTEARKELNLSFRVQTAKYPNMCFPEEEVDRIEKYWENRGVFINWYQIEKDDLDLEKVIQKGGNPCKICQSKKSDLLKRKINDRDYNESNSQVIVYGFTLFDLVSYTLEYLLGFKYNSSSKPGLFQGEKIKNRFEKQLSTRFYPFLNTNDHLIAFYPLLKYNDTEIRNAVAEKKLPLIKTTCPYRNYTPKRNFAEIYEQMEMNFDYEKVLKFAKKAFNLNDHIFSNNAAILK